jgi:hypothetical protein
MSAALMTPITALMQLDVPVVTCLAERCGWKMPSATPAGQALLRDHHHDSHPGHPITIEHRKTVKR